MSHHEQYPLGYALRMAKSRPLILLNVSANYRAFLSTCYWLQVILRHDFIKVQTVPLSLALNLPRETIVRFRQWAEQDGWLRVRVCPKDDPLRHQFAVERINPATLEPIFATPPLDHAIAPPMVQK